MEKATALISWLCGLVIISCSFHYPETIRITVRGNPQREVRGQVAASKMDCYFINVSGAGVPSSNHFKTFSADCAGLGTTSDLVTAQALSSGVTIDVPVGPNRTVQVIGITGSTGCNAQGITDILDASPSPLTFKLGEKKTDLYLDSNVSISDSYTGNAVPDLISGCRNHTLFVSSQQYGANLGGLDGADSLCSSLAKAGSVTSFISGIWRAILSNSAINAKDRISLTAGIPIKNTNGDVIVADTSQLWSGTLLHPVKYSENGNVVAASTWTGTSLSGARITNQPGDYCEDWTNNGGNNTNTFLGSPSSKDGQWMYAGGLTQCSSSESIYCINSNN